MAYGKVRVDQVQSSTRTVDVDSLATTAVATQSVAGLLSATDKTKLDGVAAGAEVNVNADWSSGSGDAQILNKPTLGTAAAKNTGTAAGNVVELDGSARLPAVDGSQLTGINAATDLTYTAATRVLASSTGTDATLTLVTSTDAGLAPASGGGTTNFLRADGTFAAPPGGTPGGSTTQFQYNNAGAFGGLSTFTTDGTNVTLTGRFISSLNGAASAPPGTFTGTWFTGGTATTTKPQVLIEPTGTTSTGWSTSGTGLGVNAASGFVGNLLDLQVNGTSLLKANANTASGTNDRLTVGNSFTLQEINSVSVPGVRLNIYGVGSSQNNNTVLDLARTLFCNGLGGGIRTNSGNYFGFSSTAEPSGTVDVSWFRDAAGTLAQRNGANAQTFRVYGTFTDASNYVRASLSSTSTAVTLAAQTAGTGADDIPLNLTAAGTGTVKVNSVAEVVVSSTVAGLPAAPVVGMLTRVTDATAPVVGTTVAGGGAAAALCWYNGAAWSVIGV